MRVPGLDSDRNVKRMKGFAGLNNTADPMRGIPGSQGVAPKTWELLQQADNVDLTNSGGAVVRDGYHPFISATKITGSFVTFDFNRFYIIDAGTLKRVHHDGSTIDLATGVTGDAHWAELNDVVYLACDTRLEIHLDDTVTPWGVPVPDGGRLTAVSGRLPPGEYRVCFTFVDEHGREGGASPYLSVNVTDGGLSIEDIPRMEGYYTFIYMASKGTAFNSLAGLPYTASSTFVYAGEGYLGRELTTQFLDPPPVGVSYIAAYTGRLYATQYLPDSKATVVWYSEPMGYHLFNLNDSFFMVPGRVVQMAADSDNLMLSTEERTFLYNQSGLEQVASYGSVPGQHADLGPDGRLYFWTTRGLCRTTPFENLTESDVSVAPGVRAAGGVIQRHGYTNFVVALQHGGSPFNKR